MLNTFFFGYLSLKWRRLVRTLCFLIIPLPISLGIHFDVLGRDFWQYGHILAGLCQGFSGLVPYLVLVTLLSWIIKPFVVKED
jgi:hypothetical protein